VGLGRQQWRPFLFVRLAQQLGQLGDVRRDPLPTVAAIKHTTP
jgi:hypothetical protein